MAARKSAQSTPCWVESLVENGAAALEADGVGLAVGDADKIPDVGDRTKHDGYFIHGESS